MYSVNYNLSQLLYSAYLVWNVMHFNMFVCFLFEREKRDSMRRGAGRGEGENTKQIPH